MNYEQEIKKLEAQIEEAQAQIKELKAEVEANQEVPPVWKPEYGGLYYGSFFSGESVFVWRDDNIDNYYLKIGNLFKTQQEADNYGRAINLIETIRRERFKAQGKWWPNEGEARYTICWYWLAGRVDIAEPSCAFSLFALGLWQDRDVLHGVVKKHEPELRWYLTEYLPSIN